MEFAGQLRHADVVLFRHAAQDEDAVRIELAVSPAAERLGRNRPALAKSRHQIDDKRGRHPEMGRRGTPPMPSLDVIHHTLAKIKRIGLRHRKSPPTGSESHLHPRRNPRRFNLTVRCSSRAPPMGASRLVGPSEKQYHLPASLARNCRFSLSSVPALNRAVAAPRNAPAISASE